MLLENNQAERMSSQKKKTPTELPKLKHNKVLNTQDRANIMKIIPARPRASLPRFHQMTLQDCSSEVGLDKILFLVKKTPHHDKN